MDYGIRIQFEGQTWWHHAPNIDARIDNKKTCFKFPDTAGWADPLKWAIRYLQEKYPGAIVEALLLD